MFLGKLIESTKKRVELNKRGVSIEYLKERLDKEKHSFRDEFPFENALKQEGISFICEVKRASPSKGIIDPDFPYKDIAKDYEKAGAHGISVLTEPEYFMGRRVYIKEISRTVNTPILRKDFIIDEYQIYESKIIGADAVLLICSILDASTLKKFIYTCYSLGMSALVEAHNETEVLKAIDAGARIIGVNNRNLKTFQVDINNCIKLRHLVPEEIIYIAESGIRNREDILLLERAKVDGVLIGETLMRSKNKRAMLSYLKGETENQEGIISNGFGV